MLVEESNDELMRLPRFRPAVSEQEEAVVHAVEQQQLRVHAVLVEIEMALNRSAHVERARSRQKQRWRKPPQFFLCGVQGIRRLRLAACRCQRAHDAAQARPELS